MDNKLVKVIEFSVSSGKPIRILLANSEIYYEQKEEGDVVFDEILPFSESTVMMLSMLHPNLDFSLFSQLSEKAINFELASEIVNRDDFAGRDIIYPTDGQGNVNIQLGDWY